MTIDEAIEYLKTEATLLHAQGFFLRENAAVLGIEALKAVKDLRNAGLWPLTKILSGETES